MTTAWRKYVSSPEYLTHPMNALDPEPYYALLHGSWPKIYNETLKMTEIEQIYQQYCSNRMSVHVWKGGYDQKMLKARRLNHTSRRFIDYLMWKHCGPTMEAFIE